MKKLYKTPEIKVVTIRPLTMLTGSKEVHVDPNSVGNQAGAESRRYDEFDWDGEY